MIEKLMNLQTYDSTEKNFCAAQKIRNQFHRNIPLLNMIWDCKQYPEQSTAIDEKQSL